MQTTTITLHTGFQIGAVDPRIFGGFLEHMGRCRLRGRLRSEVEARRRRRLPSRRAAGARPAPYDRHALSRRQLRVRLSLAGRHRARKSGRPTVRELAWQSLEPNQFGTDEFIELSRLMDWTPMITVNLGTGTPEEARQLGRVLQLPARLEICRSARGERQPGAARRQAVVPGQRDGRPLAARPRPRRPSTRSGRSRPPR